MKFAKVKYLYNDDSDWYNGKIGRIVGETENHLCLRFKDGVNKSYKRSRIERTYEAEDLSAAFRKDFEREIDRNKRSLYADMMEIRRKYSQS